MSQNMENFRKNKGIPKKILIKVRPPFIYMDSKRYIKQKQPPGGVPIKRSLKGTPLRDCFLSKYSTPMLNETNNSNMQTTMCSDVYLLITKNILSKRTRGWELKKAHA